MSIFHAYDVRGLYPKEIDEKTVYEIGRRIPKLLKSNKLMVARDERKSSPSLCKSMINGLRDSGATVVYAGVCSTPESYFAQTKLKLSAGVMITASHNPGEYNGIKFLGKNGKTIGMAEGLNKLEKSLSKQTPKKSEKKGKYVQKNMKKEYIKHMLIGIKKPFPYNIVFDQSNSPATGEKQSLKKMANVIASINTKPDGNFPGHGPNPLKPSSQKETKRLVKEKKADFGVIVDGDADRIIFIDEKSRMIPPDIMTGILAESYSKGKIIYEVRTSKSVAEKIKEIGLKPILSKAGRTIMINKMIKEKAVMGGEKSGHYFFKETQNKECITIAVKKVMQVMQKRKKPLSKIADEMIKRYATIPETNFKVKNSKKALEKVEKNMEGIKKILKIDGLSIYLKDDSWFNLRASNTETGLIRLNAEAKDKKTLKKLVEKIIKIIKD